MMQGQEKKGVFVDAIEAELQKEIEELEKGLLKIVEDLTTKIPKYFERRDEWVAQVDRRIAEKDKEIMGYKELRRKK